MSGYVDLHRLAARRAIPVLATTDANSEAALRWVAAHRPDLIVVVGWSRLLREPLLALPSRGCVGFHASLLPHGRGRAPVNWAIIRGQTQTGNTMMYLVPGVDAGDIIDQAAVPIGPDDTCETVYAAVARAGAAAVARAGAAA